MFFLLVSTSMAHEALKKLPDKYQVIFLPEEHTSKEDHAFQLRFIKFLHREDYKFVIAMEMFQKPFQSSLDDYTTCKIGEEEMLKRTEYDKRWGFDRKLYQDIWRFAKEKGIKLVAINIPSELVQRIRREGLENVRDDSLPNPVIPQTEEEKQRLRKVLSYHPEVDERRFSEVQNAWDNGMAFSISRLIELYPDRKVVVLVGRGHAESENTGIPRRLRILKPQVKIAIVRREDVQSSLLFSIDLSSENSSASSTKEPNCKP